MNRLFCILSLVLYFSFFGTAQMPDTFGNVTAIEKNMTTYDKDTDAVAVVLFERGDHYFKVVNGHVRLIKEYHTKIKILDEQGYNEGTIEIPFYHNETDSEKITKLKAVTHNGTNQYHVLPSEMFTADLTERWKLTKFTFPKIQKGSILEYTYSITSPYYHNFDGWSFQSEIPKMYSEFNARIPGNFIYNRSLTGYLKLDTNDANIKKNCFYLEGIGDADCEILKYAMKDIPAFKMDEKYALSQKNYIAQIEFEMSETIGLDGTSDKYTKSWKDVDREFRSDKDIGRQLTKKGFFEKNVPAALLTEGDALTRAKNIYKFVQNHYTWNEEYGVYNDNRVKEAFEQKKGNTAEINMSLINLLNAAEIPTHLMLLATRKRGLPKKVHPVMNDFNYTVAKTMIDGKDYLLDATDKYHPFGYLPFRALNHYGRVMDFKNESYWQDIKPMTKNKYQIRASVKFDPESQSASGVLDVFTTGYSAIQKRKSISNATQEEYLDKIEGQFEDDFTITSYEKNEERSNEEKVAERFSFELEDVLQGDLLYFNPFLVRFFDENPFKLKKRTYPIDFGYPASYRYQINIQIPEGFEVKELPEKKVITLDDRKRVTYRFHYDQQQRSVLLSFDLSLNSTHFKAQNYDILKDLFKQIVNDQKNSLVVLKKK